MTVSATSRRSSVYSGNGVATAFAFAYKVFTTADVQVLRTNADGSISTLVLNSDYSAVLNADQTATPGGTVTYPISGPPMPVGVTLVILGNLPYDQTLGLPGGGNFNPAAIEQNFDRTEMQIQQIADGVASSLRVPVGETVPVLPVAASRANYVLAFDSVGNPSVLVPVSGSAASVLTDLANTADITKGDAQVGTKNTATGGVARTQHLRNEEDLRSSDFSTLQNAVTAAAGKRLLVVGANTITAAVTVLSNTEIVLMPGASVTTSTADISHFTATSATGIKISGPGTISKTGTGTAAYVSGVKFTSCTNCHVEGVAFIGMQWAAVYLDGSSSCSVRFCYTSGALGTVQDASNVCIQNASNDNVVKTNWFYGGCEHGVLIQDPYSVNALTPLRNEVVNNIIGQHTGYGVAVYMPAQKATFTASLGPASTTLTVTAVATGTIAVGLAVSTSVGTYIGTITALGTGTGGTGTYILDTSGTVASTSMAASSLAPTSNRIIGNDIRDIQGSYATNRSSGSGIYVAGAGGGGTIVANNTISNCCVQTLDRALAPGAIGVNGILPGAQRVSVSGNIINGGVQGDGITVVSSPGGASISDNTISIPVTSNGTGPGGGGLAGTGIRIENSALVAIDNPSVICLGSSSALMIYANSAPCADITVTGGLLSSPTAPPFATLTAGGALTSNLIVNGTRIKMTTGNNYGMSLVNCNGARISADVTSSTFEALRVLTSTQVRVNGGSYIASGAPNVSTSGACTGGFMDKCAYWGTAAGGMNNGGTGFNVDWRSNAAPGAGTWAVGDFTEQSVPVVGNPKRWRCTVAGAPGTWVSEGNL
jgi:hypothetical protein